MRTISIATLLGALVLFVGCAQQGHGMGPGHGMGSATMGAGHGAMAGSEYTPGWSMMTPEECRQLRDEHAHRMEERARAQGAAGMPRPAQDACAAIQH